MIQQQTIQNINPSTITWWKGELVDWTFMGRVIYPRPEGKERHVGKYGFSFPFDSCITSSNEDYIFLYQRQGTKGVLLDGSGNLLREINRSYYHATTYEYPAAFIEHKGRTYLAHCPHSYCQLDFEDVETGEIITAIPDRKPADYFHSRLEVSPDGKYLMSKGWVWHPLDYISVYNIEECIANPLLLDKFSYMKPEANSEINIAGFIDGETALIGCFGDSELFDDESPDVLSYKQLGIWNFADNVFNNIIKSEAELGNVFVINESYAWDLYKYPKIINIQTEETVSEIRDIDSGLQNSSIIHHIKDLPLIAVSKNKRNIAIKRNNTIEILSFTG